MSLRDRYYLYCISCRDEFFKIGISSNVQDRLNALQTSNPYPLKLIWSVKTDDSVEDEKYLHHILHRENHRGEWFKISKSLAISLLDELIVKEIEFKTKILENTSENPLSVCLPCTYDDLWFL